MQRRENLQCHADEDEGDLDDSDDDEDLIIILPSTPVSLVSLFLSDFESDTSHQSSESIDSTEERDQCYQHLLGAIKALQDEVE